MAQMGRLRLAHTKAVNDKAYAQAAADLAQRSARLPIDEDFGDVAHGKDPSCHRPTPCFLDGPYWHKLLPHTGWVNYLAVNLGE
jgi:hypothetical protein